METGRTWKSRLLRFRESIDPALSWAEPYLREASQLEAGNRIETLRSGAEAYPAMLEAMRGAQREILLETYILQDDFVGQAFADVLAERSLAGVDVHLLYDAIGSWELPDEFVEDLEAAGVETVEYHPVAPWRSAGASTSATTRRSWSSTTRWRSPAESTSATRTLRWRRRRRLVRPARPRHRSGRVPVAPDRAPQLALRRRCAVRTRERTTAEPHSPVLAQTVDNWRMRNRSRMRSAYLHALRAAQQDICLMNPYFLPDFGFRRAFKRAIQQGASVRVIVPSNSDVAVVQHAMRRLYPRLLKSGVRLFEWPERMMHAKTGVIDRTWATIGSYNISRRSFQHNLEASLVIVDREYAGALQEEFDRQVVNCREVGLEECKRRSWGERALQELCYSFRYWF